MAAWLREWWPLAPAVLSVNFLRAGFFSVQVFSSLSYSLPLPHSYICSSAAHGKQRSATVALNYLSPQLPLSWVTFFLNHVLQVTSLWATSSLSFSFAISSLGSLPFTPWLSLLWVIPCWNYLSEFLSLFYGHYKLMPFTRQLQTRKLSVSRTHESNT